MTFLADRRAHIVGLGLIGGSLALALARAGWVVTGTDSREEIVAEALERGVICAAEPHSESELVVVAVPASAVVATVRAQLEWAGPDTLITDVAGVKTPLVDALDDPRFLGGHPMAGSEQRGLASARADLFVGCTWVLTPTEGTGPDRYARLHGWLRELDATVIGLNAHDHDRLVAMASHVPHLVAGALMNEAALMARSDGALLQLAAGGFRDMTRISAGDPAIWPDVLFENREAVIKGLEGLQARLTDLVAWLRGHDREALVSALTSAALARRQLPGRVIAVERLTALRVPLADRPGALAQVTSRASDLQINIYDIEIAHSVEGQPGVLILSVDEADALRLSHALNDIGLKVSWGELS